MSIRKACPSHSYLPLLSFHLRMPAVASHSANLHFLVVRKWNVPSLPPSLISYSCNLLDPSLSPKMKWGVALKALFGGTLEHELYNGTVSDYCVPSKDFLIGGVCVSPSQQSVCLVLGDAQDQS